MTIHVSKLVPMPGLPAAGEDSWIAANLPDWPVVSLDAIRAELGVDPPGKQGKVIAAARESAREHLRAGKVSHGMPPVPAAASVAGSGIPACG